MRDKIFGWIKEIVITIIILGVIMNIISFLKRPDLNSNLLPQFTYITIDEKEIHSKTYKNKPLLIHFWATWCPACKLESSNIEKFSKYYEVITIAVNSGSDDELKIYMKENDLNFIVVNDMDAIISNKFSISSFPTSFIYDKGGIVKFVEVGYTSTLGLMLRMWLAK